MALQPFVVSSLQTGLFQYTQPWIRPIDAFDPLGNCYIYRGVLNKRNAMSLFGKAPDSNPIMGITTRIDESTGGQNLVVMTTRNFYLWNDGTQMFNLITSIGGTDSIFWKGTAVATLSGLKTFWPNLVPGSVTVTASGGSTGVITDNGAGGWNVGTGIFNTPQTGSINYTTGVITIDTTNPGTTINLSITATTTGNYFTGNNTNFFNFTNWQPTDDTTLTPSVSYLWVTNDVDPVTIFDGTNLARPVLYTNAAFTENITTTQDITVFKNRLLFFRPTLNDSLNPCNQAVFYSALFNPFDFQNDIPGHGGFILAATGDIFQAEEPLRDAIICFFGGSTWLFRYTGVDFNPFRFDKINNSRSHRLPYGTTAYDEFVTSGGNTGLVKCEGVYVNRYDQKIVDFYETQMSEKYYAQTYAFRYDNLSQTWMFFVSNSNPFPVGGNQAPGSDSALVYNFLEDTWTTYTFPYPMTCMGKYFQVSGATWASFPVAWSTVDAQWDAYFNQSAVPVLLGGDVNGNVFFMDDPNVTQDTNGTTTFDITPTIVTTRWNPFINTGQKTQFAYIDVYYSIVRDAPNILELSFFFDNTENPTGVLRTLTLDGPLNSEVAWKRIYLNMTGQFVRIEFDDSQNTNFQIYGFIIWCRPAGRLTP